MHIVWNNILFYGGVAVFLLLLAIASIVGTDWSIQSRITTLNEGSAPAIKRSVIAAEAGEIQTGNATAH